MPRKPWTITTDRFISFFDILGFRDLVQRNSHDSVSKKLDTLKNTIRQVEKMPKQDNLKDFKFKVDQTKSVTFSDSIIFFSKGATLNDALKISLDSYVLLKASLEAEIPIKGALSFGKITADFKKSLFFGQPIIDAYLLHEELQMLTAVLDHSFESKLKTLPQHDWFDQMFTTFRANMKTGKATHKLIRPDGEDSVEKRIETMDKLYLSTSGKPRIYLDNTLDFFNSLLSKK